MIETRTLCNGCAECRHCGRKYQKYKALICDYCHGEVERAYRTEDGEHVCDKCIGNVLEEITEEELNG